MASLQAAHRLRGRRLLPRSVPIGPARAWSRAVSLALRYVRCGPKLIQDLGTMSLQYFHSSSSKLGQDFQPFHQMNIVFFLFLREFCAAGTPQLLMLPVP